MKLKGYVLFAIGSSVILSWCFIIIVLFFSPIVPFETSKCGKCVTWVNSLDGMAVFVNEGLEHLPYTVEWIVRYLLVIPIFPLWTWGIVFILLCKIFVC